MEEYVGQLWDRLITRAAQTANEHAAVDLEQIAPSLGVYFRAFGGDPGLVIHASHPTTHGARRTWLQRVAGSGIKVALASVDADSLNLPQRIAVFPERELNRELYLWLAAFCAHSGATTPQSWLAHCQRTTMEILERFPGLKARYQRLVAAYLPLRPDPDTLSADESAQERTIRQALLCPGSVAALPGAHKPFHPVLLWPTPGADSPSATVPRKQEDNGHEGRAAQNRDAPNLRRFRAEQTTEPEDKNGFLLMFRAESIFSWSEYARIHRSQDEEDDAEAARRAAQDMDKLTLSTGGATKAARVRFDLDLPATEEFVPLGKGISLPEWDWKKKIMRPQYCRLQELIVPDVSPLNLSPALARTSRRLSRQFEALACERRWVGSQPDGEELDLESWVRHAADLASGHDAGADNFHRAMIRQQRDLSCLVLADLSLSTDAYVSNDAQAIDVIRDSLLVFGEALSKIRDSFAMYGFSSLRRNNVRFHHLKGFNEPYDGIARGRIAGIRPGYYTRMGAAIRHATTILERQRSSQRVLLLLTDGKPNDLDQYEGRWGIEDTRMALVEARRRGIRPFCVTIDCEANDYLPHMLGDREYVVIHKAQQLPARLPLLYAMMTR